MSGSYKKDINFFNKIKKSKKNKNYLIKAAVIIHAIIGITAVFSFGVLEIQKSVYDTSYNLLNSMSTQDEILRIQENKEILNNLILRSDVYQNISDSYYEHNILSVYLIDVINSLKSTDIVENRFTYKDGVITIQANSQGIREGAAFAERLYLSNYFSDVNYRGISTRGVDSGYFYNIILYLGDDNVEDIE